MRRESWVLAVVAAFAAIVPGAASSARPLETAVLPVAASLRQGDVAYERIAGAGATKIRLILNWRDVAPASRPAGFRPGDPAQPAYRWSEFDRQVIAATQRGLEPIVTILAAPRWATGKAAGGPIWTRRPDPVELGRFAGAAATRYGGSFEGLPRVRYWMAWNEPNLHLFLNLQFVGKTPFSPGWYRGMVNRFAAGVKSVHGDNVVIAGGTAPFRDLGVTHTSWGPLGFMRELLCLDRNLKKKCNARVRFDVWAHHPYTSGGPLREAVLPDDVSLGDLPDMRRVLEAGYRAGRIVTPAMPRFWVTEFSWDTKPPDPYGVPVALHRRWVAEALYRMWQNGITLVTWYSLMDEPLNASPYQSGLYFRASALSRAKAKPALQAFRFPFVAFPEQGAVRVWGRTPGGRQARVLVEQRFDGGWRQLAILATDRNGIFNRRLAGSTKGWVRARTVDRSERAAPFSLARVPDRRFNPFGGAPIEP